MSRHPKAFELRHSAGPVARLIDFGATLQSLELPGPDGEQIDVVLGFDDPDRYLDPHPHFGSTPGRYANRIARGRFELDGKAHSLATNDGPNHLHGGHAGFGRLFWEAETEEEPEPSVRFLRRSPDGEEGYPGNLDVSVRYTLGADALRIEARAVTDAPTPLNLTHHSYWNLAGRGSVLDHTLQVDADAYLPCDSAQLPTGEVRSVAGTPMDFRRPTPIGSRIADVDGAGYDHTFVLSNAPGLRFAGRLTDPRSGRNLEVLTTEPGMQVYTGNFLDGLLIGKGDVPYARHAGVCLEAQHFPDSPNRPQFPPTTLRPGERYEQTTVYRFSPEPRVPEAADLG